MAVLSNADPSLSFPDVPSIQKQLSSMHVKEAHNKCVLQRCISKSKRSISITGISANLTYHVSLLHLFSTGATWIIISTSISADIITLFISIILWCNCCLPTSVDAYFISQGIKDGFLSWYITFQISVVIYSVVWFRVFSVKSIKRLLMGA